MPGFNNFNPGTLNRTIEIILPDAMEQDEEGFEIRGEEKLIRKCRARVTDESGTHALESGSDFSVTRRRFFIRWTSIEINTDMIVRYHPRGKTEPEEYKIVRPPNPYGDGGRFMELWTERRELV